MQITKRDVLTFAVGLFFGVLLTLGPALYFYMAVPRQRKTVIEHRRPGDPMWAPRLAEPR